MGAARTAARLARLHPAVRAALTAYDAFQLLQDLLGDEALNAARLFQGGSAEKLNGWTLYAEYSEPGTWNPQDFSQSTPYMQDGLDTSAPNNLPNYEYDTENVNSFRLHTSPEDFYYRANVFVTMRGYRNVNGETYVAAHRAYWRPYDPYQNEVPDLPEAGKAYPLEVPFANPWPAVDPMATPIRQPVPVELPVPYRVVPHLPVTDPRTDPRRAPHEAPERGPARQPSAPPEWGPSRDPVPGVRPKPSPAQPRHQAPRLPSKVIEWRPGPRNLTWRGTHHLRRPPRGVKERKFKLALTGPARTAVDAVFEGLEWVDILWDALPEHRKHVWIHTRPAGLVRVERRPGVKTKMRDIYLHFDEIRLDELLTGVAENAVEDAFFGKLGKASKEVAQRHGWAAGPQFGPAL